jgi:hypothetical protein
MASSYSWNGVRVKTEVILSVGRNSVWIKIGPGMPQASWFFFLALESDLDATARYVEPTDANDNTYSIEFARILMSAAAEVEVVGKLLLASKGVSLPSKPNIGQLRELFQKHYPKLPSMEVFVPRAERILRPWAAWTDSPAITNPTIESTTALVNPKDSANPDWWSAYNNVKHARHAAFQQATLANALDAVAALFCLQLYLHQELYNAGCLQPWCRLLTLIGHYDTVVTGAGGVLPDFPRVTSP